MLAGATSSEIGHLRIPTKSNVDSDRRRTLIPGMANARGGVGWGIDAG